MKNQKKCLILDGNNLIHRSYHAAKKVQWMKENKEIYIFLKIFISVLRKEEYQKIFIVFDGGKNTFRKRLNESYKENREKSPEELIKHLKNVQVLIGRIGLKFISSEEFEADDLIASFIRKFQNKEDYQFHIFSQDKDLFQLLKENVKILRYSENKLEKFGDLEFTKEKGFLVENFPYYLSLIGDKVDNVKGIEGIGEKRAQYIVSNFKTIENTFENINLVPKEIRTLLEKKRVEVEKNLQIISLVESIPLENWETYDFSWEKLRKNESLIEFCKDKKMNSILNFLNGTQSRTRTDTD